MKPFPKIDFRLHRLMTAYYGWRIVASSFVVNAIHDGTYFLGLSIFFLPISRDFKLSYLATSLPFTLNKIMPSILGPFSGMLIDRHGPARILIISALLSGAGWLMLSQTHSYMAFICIMILFLSVGMMGWINCTTTAVGVWFRIRRSSAMAIIFTGCTVGGAIIPPTLAWSVGSFGWRATMLAVGIGVWVLVIPLATIIRSSPEAVGLLPDGDPVKPKTTISQPKAPLGHTVLPLINDTGIAEALRTPAFLLLTMSTAISGMVGAAFALHMVAIMTAKGLEETTAGYLVGLLSVFMAPLVLIMGWLGDHWHKNRIAAAGHLTRALAFALLFIGTDINVWHMIAILVLLSPTEGIWALSASMLSDMFGRRHIATLRGTMLSCINIFSIGMPVTAGWIFDRTGGYDWLLGPFIGMSLLAALLLWLLPRFANHTRFATA